MAFELDSEEAIDPKELMAEIHSSQTSLFGDAGSAQNRLRLISFNGKFGLLRFSHKHITETRAVLASVYSIGSIRVALRVKGISGTIKSATEKYIPQLSQISAGQKGRRIELDEVSGCIIDTHGREIDLYPDDRDKIKGSDTRYLGLTSFDLCGGHDDADGTPDGLRQGHNCIQP